MKKILFILFTFISLTGISQTIITKPQDFQKYLICRDSVLFKTFLRLYPQTSYILNPKDGDLFNFKDTLKYYNGFNWITLGTSSGVSTDSSIYATLYHLRIELHDTANYLRTDIHDSIVSHSGSADSNIFVTKKRLSDSLLTYIYKTDTTSKWLAKNSRSVNSSLLLGLDTLNATKKILTLYAADLLYHPKFTTLTIPFGGTNASSFSSSGKYVFWNGTKLQTGLKDSTSFQTALTNPVTGTGTSGQVAYFNGTTTITSNTGLLYDGTQLGIGITPTVSLDVNGAARFAGTLTGITNATASGYFQSAFANTRTNLNIAFSAYANSAATGTYTIQYSPLIDLAGRAYNSTSKINRQYIYERPAVTASGTKANIVFCNGTINGSVNTTELMAIGSNGNVSIADTAIELARFNVWTNSSNTTLGGLPSMIIGNLNTTANRTASICFPHTNASTLGGYLSFIAGDATNTWFSLGIEKNAVYQTSLRAYPDSITNWIANVRKTTLTANGLTIVDTLYSNTLRSKTINLNLYTGSTLTTNYVNIGNYNCSFIKAYNDSLVFNIAGTKKMILNSYGCLALGVLGTGIPILPALFQMIDESNRVVIKDEFNTNPDNGFVLRSARGTVASPSAIQTDNSLGFIGFRGYGTSQFPTFSTGYIAGYAEANFTNSSMPTYLIFSTTPSGSVSRVVRLKIFGNGRSYFYKSIITNDSIFINNEYLTSISAGIIKTASKISTTDSGYFAKGVNIPTEKSYYVGGHKVLDDNNGYYTLIGTDAGYLLDRSQQIWNVAIGNSALYSNISGDLNCAVGISTLRLETGSYNTAVGNLALYAQGNQDYSIGLGFRAGYNNILPSRLFINSFYRSSIEYDTTYSIIYGYMADAVSTQRLTLNAKLYLPYLGSAGTGTALVIDANKQIIPLTSSQRFKENIRPLEINTSKIYDLQPKSFTYKESKQPDFGYIAEEVYQIIPELVNLDSEGKPYSLKDYRLSVLLLEEMKKQKKQINDQQTQINTQQIQINDLTKRLEKLEQDIITIPSDINIRFFENKYKVGNDILINNTQTEAK